MHSSESTTLRARRSRRKLFAGLLPLVVIAMALIVGAATCQPAGPPVGSTKKFTATCALSITDVPKLYQIRSTFSATFVGTVQSSGKIRIGRIDYKFGFAEYYQWPSGKHLGQVERGNKSNVNILKPVSRNSADNLAPQGSYTFSTFDISNNTLLSVQGVLDVKNVPDPACTASVTAGW